MPPDVIAEYELVARHGEGEPFAVHLAIGKPVLSARMAPAWSCAVSVQPLWSEPFEIFGEGSFQALCLGAKHAVQMLATFMAQGGVLEYPGGEPFDPEVFGFSLLPSEAAGGSA